MQAPDLAVKELRRCIQDLGLQGVQIGSHINNWNLDAVELFPIFEEAANLGAAVFVHPWDMLGSDRMPNYFLPWLVGMPAETCLAICSLIFGGVLERLPNLKIAFAHGGGSFPSTIGRIEKGFLVRPDLCQINGKINPRQFLGKFWVDSLVHDEKMLRHLVELFGSKRVMLGSDYPFPLGEVYHPGSLDNHYPGSLIEKTFNDQDPLEAKTKADLFQNSALEFLGVTRDRFL